MIGITRPQARTARRQLIVCPAGVCIQLFTDKIQNAEMNVPTAAMRVAKKCNRLPTFCMPNNMTPRKPASRKKSGQHLVHYQRGR